MKNLFYGLIGLCGAALFSGWSNYNAFAAELEAGCASSGGNPEECSCFADNVSAEYSMFTFAGLGPFRPLMDEASIEKNAMSAALSCAAQG